MKSSRLQAAKNRPPDRRTVGNSEPTITGEVFPGHPLVRERIRFKDEDVQTWKKKYQYNKSHSPCLFTVVCSSEHPKLLGVSVMEESESIETAISALITRFPVLPRVCFYDNACNMSSSIGLRFKWMFERTTFVCDRFYYLSHRCSSLYDPDSFKECDEIPTSGAESLNKQWCASRTHIRYLGKDNVRMFFMNMRAHVRSAGCPKNI